MMQPSTQQWISYTYLITLYCIAITWKGWLGWIEVTIAIICGYFLDDVLEYIHYVLFEKQWRKK